MRYALLIALLFFLGTASVQLSPAERPSDANTAAGPGVSAARDWSAVEHRAADDWQWRRTIDGWQKMPLVRPTTPRAEPLPHPVLLAALQVLLALAIAQSVR